MAKGEQAHGGAAEARPEGRPVEDALSEDFFAAREAELRGRVSAKRFAHVQGVVAMAERLARTYGVDVARARLAALLHDWDKGYDDEGVRERARDVGAQVDPWLVEHMPRLLHGPTAARALGRAFPSIPEDVLLAIDRHTTGSTDMSATWCCTWPTRWRKAGSSGASPSCAGASGRKASKNSSWTCLRTGLY